MKDKYSKNSGEDDILVREAYVKLWGKLQGALHPYVKQLMPLVERSLIDPKFKKRMIEDSEAVFREAKIKFEKGVEIKVVEESQNKRYLVLPPPIESIPSARRNIFNNMLTSGTLNSWFQDDSDGPDIARSAGVPTGADGNDRGNPVKDSWSPF